MTNKQYCQSCILLVLCIIQTYDARKLKHKIRNTSCFCTANIVTRTPSTCVVFVRTTTIHFFSLEPKKNFFSYKVVTISNYEFVARSLACLKYRFLFLLVFLCDSSIFMFLFGGSNNIKVHKEAKNKTDTVFQIT